MIKQFIPQWEENKHKLEEYFRNTEQTEHDYESIVTNLFKLVITEATREHGYKSCFDVDKMTVIDDGDYQGTQIFIIPIDTYQPSVEDYVMLDNYYGSCSGCDTLLSISEYDSGLPNESQVKEYMTLALHLFQSLRWLQNQEDSQ